jgi:signal transduction histidine kinase
MASSLRARLLISYVVVILVCLALAALTLMVVARPVQQRLLTFRLSSQMALVAPRVRTLVERGRSPEQITDALARVLAGRGRFLLLDRQGNILGDTDGKWTGKRLLDRPSGANGSLTGPDGSDLAYAGVPVGGSGAGDPAWVIVVAPLPRAVASLVGDLGEGLLTAGLLALVVSILLAALIAHSVARPLQQIARAAEAVAAGDYDQKLDIRSPDEVRVLAQRFEAMAQQVKANQQAMRDLVANVSHDLKTPLTSIQGFAQALLEGETRDEAARQQAATVIHDEAGRMVRMVEELLDLARIESGQLVLERHALDMGALIGGVVQALAPAAAQKQVALEASLSPLPPVVGDGDRLAQVFTNLLDNALKYTPEGGRVQVKAQVITAQPSPRRSNPLIRLRASPAPADGQAGWVEVSVADTGRGIPAQDLPRVFERFYQVDKARAARRGSGLGLAIAKEIVEAHGGRISVESAEGQGARFTVVLPVGAGDREVKHG